MADSITCPFCGRTSHHPQDVAQRYCGACHVFIDMEYRRRDVAELIQKAHDEAVVRLLDMERRLRP